MENDEESMCKFPLCMVYVEETGTDSPTGHIRTPVFSTNEI